MTAGREDRHAPLLNVVRFGAQTKLLHEHVLTARDNDHRFDDPSRFHLDDWHPRPRPGMAARPALITYIPAHGGWWPDPAKSSLGADSNSWAPLDQFGEIGGQAVVLDACETASNRWLYDGHGHLRPECQSLAGKPLLGGSGIKQPQKAHGPHILAALFDLLAGLNDAAMPSEDDLLSLLTKVRDHAAIAAAKSAHNSTLRTAYKPRRVTATLTQSPPGRP